VGAERVDEVGEEAEEDGERAAVDERAEGADEHEHAVEAVGEAEEVAQGGRRGGLAVTGRPGIGRLLLGLQRRRRRWWSSGSSSNSGRLVGWGGQVEGLELRARPLVGGVGMEDDDARPDLLRVSSGGAGHGGSTSALGS